MRGGLVLLIGLALPLPGRRTRAGRSTAGCTTPRSCPSAASRCRRWITEENDDDDDGEQLASRPGASAPFIGITDQLELGLPLEIVWFAHDPARPTARRARRTTASSCATAWSRRIRVTRRRSRRSCASRVKRLVARARRDRSPRLDFVALVRGGQRAALVDVGFVARASRDDEHRLRAAARRRRRASSVVDDLRFGAEVFAQISLDDCRRDSWVDRRPEHVVDARPVLDLGDVTASASIEHQGRAADAVGYRVLRALALVAAGRGARARRAGGRVVGKVTVDRGRRQGGVAQT